MPERKWASRAFREGDEHRILELLTAAFGRWPGVDIEVEPLEHLRWKLHSDALAAPYHRLAANGERVVGCQLVIRQRYKVRDQVAAAFLTTDLAVHPNYQGHGMIQDLWVTGTPGYAAVIDLTIGVSGNRLVGRQRKRASGKRDFANAIEVLECPLPSPDVARNESVIRTVPRFDARIDRLWERASEDFSCILERRAAYMNWRYADPRAGRFTIRFAEENGELLGYAALRRSGGKAYIADLLTLPQREDIVRALVADAVRHFSAGGDTSVRCWLARRHDYRPLLLECGFQPIRGVRGINWTSFGTTEIDFFAKDERAAVHFSIGDTDLV